MMGMEVTFSVLRVFLQPLAPPPPSTCSLAKSDSKESLVHSDEAKNN